IALLGSLPATLGIAEALALVAGAGLLAGPLLVASAERLLVSGASQLVVAGTAWPQRGGPFATPLGGSRVALLALLVAVPLDLVLVANAGAVAVEFVGVDLVADVDVAGVDVDVVAATPPAVDVDVVVVPVERVGERGTGDRTGKERRGRRVVGLIVGRRRIGGIGLLDDHLRIVGRHIDDLRAGRLDDDRFLLLRDHLLVVGLEITGRDGLVA